MNPVVRAVVERAAEVGGVPVEGILSASKVPQYAWPRQVVYYILRQHHGLGTTDIGKALGRNHATVSKGVQHVGHRIAVDRDAKLFVLDVAGGDLGDSLSGLCSRIDAELAHAREVVGRLEHLKANLEREMSGRRRTLVA